MQMCPKFYHLFITRITFQRSSDPTQFSTLSTQYTPFHPPRHIDDGIQRGPNQAQCSQGLQYVHHAVRHEDLRPAAQK